jgi:hypothetical protein
MFTKPKQLEEAGMPASFSFKSSTTSGMFFWEICPNKQDK